MDKKIDEKVIAQYQEDEENMILVFVQWCVNHDIDAAALYQKAYPGQPVNDKLNEALENTTAKDQAESIPNDLLMEILELFGNDALAQAVYEEIETKDKQEE